MIDLIKQKIKTELGHDDLIVEEPKKGMADLAIPLFAIARQQGLSPQEVYEKFAVVVQDIPEVERTAFSNGFLNIFLVRSVVGEVILKDILARDHTYGTTDEGHDKTVVMDYSSPNIAKRFSVGHLRSTMIGNALRHLYEKAGYKVVSINHLGDWGTQFGKMIVAYRLWGDDQTIKQNPIDELQKLYVRFHKVAEDDTTLEQQARDALLKLEQGDPETVALWQWFKDESMREFMDMYDLLGVSFDAYAGESFYNDKMEPVVAQLAERGLLRIDEGATIVDLEHMPPALIKRSDGATLYMTRDLAALLYRYETYQFDKILYIVGNEQKLHFRQLKALSDKMGYDVDLVHVNFGLVLVDGKKMSTRSGRYARLEDVVSQAIHDAKTAIMAKNPDLQDKDDVAKAVGVGALIFNDLKNERHLDIDLNLENMLKFEGHTGPYLQYSGVRIASILKTCDQDTVKADLSAYVADHYFDVIMQLAQFPDIIEKARLQHAPNVLARYLVNLAQAFNSFYGKERIVVEEEGRLQANLLFVKAIQIVIVEGLRLLGITPLEEM